MSKFKLAGICILTSTLALSGCVTRTYNLTRDRIDQDLSSVSGNRGYITGTAPEPAERETTRTIKVIEVELGFAKRSPARFPSTTPLATSVEEPLTNQEAQDFEQYSVGKDDTLQKISKKFYNTTKKWPKIYEANKDILRTPDKLCPGQTLKIPKSKELKTESQDIVETKENLK